MFEEGRTAYNCFLSSCTMFCSKGERKSMSSQEKEHMRGPCRLRLRGEEEKTKGGQRVETGKKCQAEEGG